MNLELELDNLTKSIKRIFSKIGFTDTNSEMDVVKWVNARAKYTIRLNYFFEEDPALGYVENLIKLEKELVNNILTSAAVKYAAADYEDKIASLTKELREKESEVAELKKFKDHYELAYKLNHGSESDKE